MHYITKMFNLDDITNESNREHYKKWSFIPDYLYRILIIGSSGSRKIKVLLNLIKEQDDIDTIYLHAKDLGEPKYDYLIISRKDVGIKYCNDPNAFIEYSNSMDDVYEKIDEYNPNKKKNSNCVR